MRERGLREGLTHAFLLQALWIGAAAVVGVLVAWLLLEDVLIRNALRDEAAHFWSQRDIVADFPLPDTRNMKGYLGVVPEELGALAPGFHDVAVEGQRRLVFVDLHRGERLYLAFDSQRVRSLAAYFGLIPLALVLLLLYVSMWLGFRASRRAVSPVIALAREVRTLDPDAAVPQLFESQLSLDTNDEVRELATALSRYAERLQALVARERQFTRDASHELRSPLTVMRGAADLLLTNPDLTADDRRQVERILRASKEMEELIKAFLLIARQDEAALPVEPICVNTVLEQELERAQLLASGKPIEVRYDPRGRLYVEANEKVLSALLGNLLRNAFSYTDAGRVAVEVHPQRIVIEDSGIGMPAGRIDDMYRAFVRGDTARRGGHGVGLTIVRRLSDRFAWPVEIASEPGVGTRVQVSFPTATFQPDA